MRHGQCRRCRCLDEGDGEREREGQRGCVTSCRLRWEVEVWAVAVASLSG